MKSTTNTWTFARNSVTVNGKTFPASYSLARGGDVYVFTTLRADDGTDMPVRIHIGQDMPMHAEAVAAAKPIEAAAPMQDKPAPVQEAPAKKASRKADKPAEAAPMQDKPAPVQEAPAKKAAAPVDKPWIGTTITGKGWNIAFDQQAGRTRVLFQEQPTDAQKAAIESAGFYWSAQLQSWNKKLTCKAYRAAQALAATLNALA